MGLADGSRFCLCGGLVVGIVDILRLCTDGLVEEVIDGDVDGSYVELKN